MKIAIVGVGAIGGFVGIRLALAGEQVTFIARGGNLQTLRTQGLRLLSETGDETLSTVNATSDYAAAGPQDLVILAMKAHQVAAVAPDIPKLFGPDTVVVPMQNGIPYWYFHRHGGALAGTRVHSVDPTGLIGEKIPGERVIGCVVYPATELVSHGVIRHIEQERRYGVAGLRGILRVAGLLVGETDVGIGVEGFERVAVELSAPTQRVLADNLRNVGFVLPDVGEVRVEGIAGSRDGIAEARNSNRRQK